MESSSTFRTQNFDTIWHICKNTKVFVDTSSFMAPGYPLLEETLFSALRVAKEKLILAYSVIEELENIAQKQPAYAATANTALRSIHTHEQEGLISIRRGKADGSARNVILAVFTKFRLNYDLTLITQNNRLAQDIIDLNDSRSQQSKKKILVYRITKYGTLGRNTGITGRPGGPCDSSRQESLSRDASIPRRQEEIVVDAGQGTVSQGGAFSPKAGPWEAAPRKPREDEDISLLVDKEQIPQSGELVYAIQGQKKVRLLNELGKGGEGTVYATDIPQVVCKIYSYGKMTMHRCEKLGKFIERGLRFDGICWPVDIVLNRENKPVGYLMPAAKGWELRRSVFLPYLQKRFPLWTRKELVQLCITILRKIQYIHDNGVLIGDLNCANILVAGPTEVYFVDTDSYQVDDLPCPVGTDFFTAPELQNKDLKTLLRSPGNESFAIATLLFMILLPGKSPYAQQDGADAKSNIARMDFSYPFGDKSNKKTPNGPWRFCWSHLTYELKGAFYNTFRYDGLNAREEQRLPVSRWLSLMEKYFDLLDSGKFSEQDPESIKILPGRFKIVGNIATCKLCQREFAEEGLIEGYCHSCLHDKGMTTLCSECHKPILYTNFRRLIMKKPPFQVCSECYQAAAEVHEKRICIDCHTEFVIPNGEKNYFTKHSLELPKRCPSCRKAKGNNTYTATAQKARGPYQQSAVQRPPKQPSADQTPQGHNLLTLKGLLEFVRDTFR